MTQKWLKENQNKCEREVQQMKRKRQGEGFQENDGSIPIVKKTFRDLKLVSEVAMTKSSGKISLTTSRVVNLDPLFPVSSDLHMQREHVCKYVHRTLAITCVDLTQVRVYHGRNHGFQINVCIICDL